MSKKITTNYDGNMDHAVNDALNRVETMIAQFDDSSARQVLTDIQENYDITKLAKPVSIRFQKSCREVGLALSGEIGC